VAGPADLVFRDGFEGGSLAAWTSASTNTGKLSVTTSASLAGQFGLQAVSSGTTALYTEDTSPSALASYHARFRFSPNGAVISSSGTQDVFTALDIAQNPVLSVQVRGVTGGYEIRIRARVAGGSMTSSAWAPLSNGPHTVEVGWTAASLASGRNGLASLWLDGSLVRSIGGLTNGTFRLETARLGLQNMTRTVTGTEFFDNFASTRGSYIGL
jgi:hypothetical protein